MILWEIFVVLAPPRCWEHRWSKTVVRYFLLCIFFFWSQASLGISLCIVRATLVQDADVRAWCELLSCTHEAVMASGRGFAASSRGKTKPKGLPWSALSRGISIHAPRLGSSTKGFSSTLRAPVKRCYQNEKCDFLRAAPPVTHPSPLGQRLRVSYGKSLLTSGEFFFPNFGGVFAFWADLAEHSHRKKK